MGTKIASHVSPGLAKATSAFDKASTYISPFISGATGMGDGSMSSMAGEALAGAVGMPT